MSIPTVLPPQAPAPMRAPPARPVRSDFLLFSPPAIGQDEIDEVVDTLRTGWITTGPKTRRFEEEFRLAVEAPAALALNSATAGLHLALAALGLGPGDEVITTTLTFVACANVIEHVGARPVLVDVEPDTLNISPEAIERALTPRTRALLPVHYAGHPVDLDAVRAIADARNLAIVEDAAHALPARYRGRLIGSDADPVAFSFYATKNLTTGEGGMLTGAPELVDRARVLSLHGMSRDAWKRYEKGGSWFYDVVSAGFKCNMSDLQASIGLAQLRRLEGFQARRREIVARYVAVFGGCDAFELPVERPEVEHAWHLFVLRLRPGVLGIGRDEFVRELAERNIGTSVHFIPIHLHRYFRERLAYAPDAFPVAVVAYQRMLSLPLHPALTDDDVDDVVTAALDVVDRYRR
jgi:dTDP-4-amino-4,6-dideoxygalactose transaminase